MTCSIFLQKYMVEHSLTGQNNLFYRHKLSKRAFLTIKHPITALKYKSYFKSYRIFYLTYWSIYYIYY